MRNGRKKEAFAVIIFCLLIASAMPRIQADGDTIVYFDTTSYTVHTGDTFEVNIIVEPNNEINTFATNLVNYSQSLVNCTDVRQQTLFTYSTAWLNGTIDNDSGTISGIVWGSNVSTTANGTFVTLVFEAMAEGTAYIEIDESKVQSFLTGQEYTTAVSNNVTVDIQTNHAPTVSNEDPINGSTVDPGIAIDWMVDMNDTEGDTFNWTIDCSDGTNDSAINDTNGTKTFTIANPTFGTTYILWVNVTDGMDWTRAWYTVTVRNQYVPDPPTDFNATKINLTAINLTWTKNISADTTYLEVNSEALWDFGNGTEIYNNTGEQWTYDGLPPDHYYFQAWSYNDTDNTYSSTYAEADVLTGENDPVVLSNELPTNGSSPIDIMQSSVSILLSDNESDTISYMIHSPYLTNESGSGGNNTYTASVITPLPFDTVITWYVNATDGFEWTNATYQFTTRDQYIPADPTNVLAETRGPHTINISWLTGTATDMIIVESNTTGSWMESYNGSGASYEDIGLTGHSTYYYRVHAYNATDNTLSNYIYVSNTTENTAPEEPTAVHIKTKTGFGKNYTSVYDVRLNVTVSDNESDTLDVYFYWGNDEAMGFIGTIASGDSAEFDLATYCNDQSYWYNETEGMGNPGTWEPRNFLNHSTNYTWYVIVDDGMNTTQSPLYWFNTSARWDLVEDGDMTLDDITQRLVSEWYYKPEPFYPGGSIDTDIIEDGFIDLTDLSEFTSHWYDAPWYTE